MTIAIKDFPSLQYGHLYILTLTVHSIAPWLAKENPYYIPFPVACFCSIFSPFDELLHVCGHDLHLHHLLCLVHHYQVESSKSYSMKHLAHMVDTQIIKTKLGFSQQIRQNVLSPALHWCQIRRCQGRKRPYFTRPQPPPPHLMLETKPQMKQGLQKLNL